MPPGDVNNSNTPPGYYDPNIREENKTRSMDLIFLNGVILSVGHLTLVLLSKKCLKFFLIRLCRVHLYNFVWRNHDATTSELCGT